MSSEQNGDGSLMSSIRRPKKRNNNKYRVSIAAEEDEMPDGEFENVFSEHYKRYKRG